MASSLPFKMVLLLVYILVWCNKVCVGGGIFDVTKYGARADRKTENSNAFLTAWREACKSGGSTFFIPRGGAFLVNPIQLEGPCAGRIKVEVDGLVKAPKGNPGTDAWITFININGFTMQGSGTFDGEGASTWHPNGKPLPVSVAFYSITNGDISGISSINSKGFHIGIVNCQYVVIHSVKITAPKNSPNTDGIHIQGSKHIQVFNSPIGTGDDCVSIGHGSVDVNVSDVHCGPGHGFSVGSIGRYSREQSVTGIRITSCTVTETQNGVRIKTWSPSKSAVTISDVTFRDIIVVKAFNPIIIDQKYCGGPAGCSGDSRVQLRNIKFIRVSGMSSSEVSVNLQCSSTNPCRGILLDHINLNKNGTGQTASHCKNAQVSYIKEQNPPRCA